MLIYNGVDDYSNVGEHKDMTELILADRPRTLFAEFNIIENKIDSNNLYIDFFRIFSVYRDAGIFGLTGTGNIRLSDGIKTNHKYVVGVSIYENKVSSYIDGVKRDLTREHNNVFNAISTLQTNVNMSVTKLQLFDRYMTADEMEEILTNA